MSDTQLAHLQAFREWFLENGGYFHPQLFFRSDDTGLAVRTRQEIPRDTVVISCPLKLAITVEVARKALTRLLRGDSYTKWSERQQLCTYIVMHWVVDDNILDKTVVLQHQAYLDILPPPQALLTPLHFSDAELELFKGSNVYGAAHDRRRQWLAEWSQCQALVKASSEAWGGRFTWERYLTASTYLSSPANTYPVLLPGVDSLNHARAHPVTWHVGKPSIPPPPTGRPTELAVSLITNTRTLAGHELLNNYGPKPNAELLLGYGFSLEDNPDDTIVLQVGGGAVNEQTQKWEVGRDARGVELVWGEVKRRLRAVKRLNRTSPNRPPPTYDDWDIQDELGSIYELSSMVETLLDKLPKIPSNATRDQMHVRPEVVEMLQNYVTGQRDILRSMLVFVSQVEQDLIAQAQSEGIELQFEDD